VLLIQASFLVELLHLALDDLLDDLLGLAGGACLGAINLALLFEHLWGHIFAADIAGIDGGDMHGHVVAKILEGLGTGDEIAFAINFDDHADFSARMNVVPDQPLGGFAGSFFGSGCLAFFAEDFDGLLEKLLGGRRLTQLGCGLNQGGTAIAEPGVGSLAKFLYELSWNFHDWFACTHPFCSSKL